MHLGTSAKLAIILVVLKWYYVVDLILDSIWIVLVFHSKLCAFRIDFSHHVFLFCFYLGINKSNIQNNIIVISSFQTGLNELFSSTGFYFESKVIEGSHEKKKKNMFLNFWDFFLKIFIFEVVTFFSRLVIQSTQFFSGSTYR